LLNITRGVVIEIVEADLAPGDNFRVPRELIHAIKRSLVRQLGFMGMDTDGRVDEFVFLSESDTTIEVDRTVSIADRDDDLDTAFTSTRNDLLAIGIEAVAFEMGVGVDEHSRQSSVFSKNRC